MESNSALRLIKVLDKLKGANANTPIAKVIKEIFNDDEESRIGVHIGQIFTLSNTVHKQVLALPDFDPDVDLQWMPGVYAGLSTLSVKGNVNNFREAYPLEVRAFLLGAARNLGKHFPDLSIDSEQLKNIYEEISPLIDQLLEDRDIDQTLKNFILDKLRLIQDVIVNSSVVGFSELVTHVESAYAGTIFRVGGVENVQTAKKKSEILANFIDWLGRTLILLEAGKIGYLGISTIARFLLEG